MRQAVFALLALAAAAPATCAQGWANKLFKNQTTHDFGTVPCGAQLLHRFPITNIYAVPLEISQVRVSCGCVTATPSKKVLPSRETGTIDVTMDARRFKGAKTVTVYVSVGPTYVSTAELRVSANSRADVVFNPGQVSFGVVPRGQTATQTIDVEYAGVQDWQVSEIVKNDAPVDATLQQLYREQGRVGYRVTVSLKPDAPAGRLRHELLLKTNDPASPLVPVLVEATVQASLSVVPSVIALRPAPKVGDTKTYRVVVSGTKPFQIKSIEGLGEGLEAELPTSPAPVQTVVLKYLPPKSGEVKRSLHIRTDLDTSPVVTVTFEGSVKP